MGHTTQRRFVARMKISEEIHKARDIKINRNYFPVTLATHDTYKLHIFADASTQAYG